MEQHELKTKLEALQAELKSYFDKGEAEMKKHGGILEDTQKKMSDLQKQVDAIDLQLQSGSRLTSGGSVVSGQNEIEQQMKDSDSLSRLLKDKRGTGVINFKDAAVSHILRGRKTTITETGQGFMTTGVMPIERIPGIVPEARQVLTIRDLLSARPTTMAVVDFVRVQTPLSPASPAPEASTKVENQLSFVSLSEKVRTLAHFLPASKQILDDMTELMGFIQTSMPYYTNIAEEQQLLFGDGTGENLHGLVVQAAPFIGGLPANSSRIDAIGTAIEQITTAKELPPTFAIVHPADWWSMRLLKDSYGRYILGSPQTVVAPTLFGLDVVYTTSMTKGTFLVGSGSPIASEIRDRMELQVEISTEHANFFIQNLVAIRAEKRLALIVKRPNSYVQGSFAGLN